MAGVKKELWTGMMIDSLRFIGTWAAGITDESRWVGNDVIHLADLGADPAVLIDNTTYPIAVNSQVDNDLTVSLKKLETENTKITEDELYGLPYDKPGAVFNKHRMRLEEVAMQYGLHTIAPPSNTVNTPVLKTTGANDETGTRKTLLVKDIASLKKALDNLKVPMIGRRLVLCPDHVQDLLNTSESFQNQYKDNRAGRILNLYGFEIHEDLTPVRYNTTTLARMAFGATPTVEKPASVAFWANDVFQAKGSVQMFYRLAQNDPEYRQTTAGFRMYHLMSPYKRRSQAAIVSDVNA